MKKNQQYEEVNIAPVMNGMRTELSNLADELLSLESHTF